MMTGNNEEKWTESEKATLKRLWEEEGLSSSQIGAIMGKSRNAVIGKVHRMKLTGRRATKPVSRTYRALADIKVKKAKEPKPPKLKPIRDKAGRKWNPIQREKPDMGEIKPLNGIGIPILESRDQHCKAVLDHRLPPPDRGLAHYCGLPAFDGESYCVEHYLAFHQPPRPRLR